MGSKNKSPALIWTRWFIPILYLVSGLMRSSVPSVIYTLLAFFHGAWGRIPSVRTTLSSIFAIIVAILSLVAEKFVYDKKNVNSYILWMSGGINYSGTRHNLYFASDILVIATSVLALLANIIAWGAKRREKKKLEDLSRLEKRREEAHNIDKESKKKRKEANDDSGDGSESSSKRHNSYLTSETGPDEESESEDESDDEKKEEVKSSSEEQEVDDSPAILRFVAEMPTSRSFCALIVASIAACFMPTVLTAPYAIFVIISGLYFAHPRRNTTKLNFAKFMTKFGLIMEIYTVLYVLATHAFQLYLSYSIVEGKAMKDFSWRHWVGIFHYTEFYNEDGWMICVGYAATLLLFFILSPSLNCARVIKDSELNEINSRCRLSISAKILVICKKNQEKESEGKSSVSGFSILAQAMYPHGWKVCWFIIFYMAIMSPGIPSYILIALVMLSSFFSSKKSAEFSIPALYLYWIIFAGQFFVRISTPITKDNYAKHTKWYDSFSVTLRSKNYCGLALTLFLMGFLFMILFERVKGVFKLVEKIGVNAIDKETYDKCVAEIEEKERKKQEKEKKREEKLKEKKKTRKEREEEKRKKEEEEGKLRKELSKEQIRERKRLERRETLNKIHDSFFEKGEKTGKIIRRTLMTILILILRNAYLISLVILYFAALQGTNIINFAFIVFFIILLIFPKAPGKMWNFFTAFVDIVLLARLIWQLHFLPNDSRITKVIGLEKGTKQHVIAEFLWEVLLVTSCTVQLFFFAAADRADEVRQEEKDKRMRKLAEEEKQNGGEDSEEEKEEEKEQLSQSFRSGISVSGTLDSLAAANGMELITKIKNIAMFLLERCGVILCILAWLFIGTLIPISAVSLLFVFLACLGTLIFFHASDAMKHFKRAWAVFLVIQAILLFAEYAYQFEDLHDYVVEKFDDSSVSEKISIDEIGLVYLKTSKRMYLGLLPYLVSFVLTAIQLRFFRAARSLSLAEDTLPIPVSGAIDFVCRLVLEYAPVFLYIYLALELVRLPSAIHLAILFFMMFGRLFTRGFDVTLALIMWLSVILILGTLTFNLRAFDRYAFDNVRLFRWIGLSREYVPNDDLKPHTECLIMTREYIITVILLTIQRMSLIWGQEVATKVGWCADRPRRLPLFRFIDDYPDWDEEKRESHTWHRVLFTACNLPWMLMPQFVFIVILVALYLRSNTVMGWIYFFATLVCLYGSDKTRRHTSSLLGIVIILMVTGQYFLYLGFPNTDDSSLDPLWPWADVLSPAFQEWLLIHMTDTTSLVIDVILLYFLCAFRALRPEDKTFMTIFVPTEEYKTRSLEKRHKNHFTDKKNDDDEGSDNEYGGTVNLVEARKAAKERELGRKGKKKEKKNSEEAVLREDGEEKEEEENDEFDEKAFPNTPRKGTNTARYVFYRVIVILVLIALFAVGCSRTSVVSLIYLIFTVVMAMKHDFLLSNIKPWKKLLRVTYIILSIQMLLQLVSVIIVETVKNYESTFEWLGPLTRVIGIDYTTEGAVTPTYSVLYLVSVLGVVSIVHILNRDLADQFKLVRQYIDHGQKRSADSAIRVYRFSMDVVIAKLREIFQEKADRRHRLDHLRESRKHKGVLFPELMRVIGDGASSSGSSQLSIEEQKMMRANAEKEGSESDEEEKIPLKVHFKILLYKIRNLLIRAVDKIIFLLHGKEGEVEGNRFAHDLAVLHEDHKALCEPIRVDAQGNEIKDEKQEGDDDPEHPRLTKAALSGINKAYDAEQLLLRAKETLKMLQSQDAEILDEINDVESEGNRITIMTLARNSAVSKMVGNMSVGAFTAAWANQEARIVAIVQRATAEEDDQKHISIGELTIVYPFVRDSGSVKNIGNVFMGDLFTVICKDANPGAAGDSGVRDVSTSRDMGVSEGDSAAAAAGANSADSVNGDDTEMSDMKRSSGAEAGKTESGRSSRWRLFYKGLYICLCLHTESICMLAFIICHLANGTILSLMYVLFGFAYLVIAPRPLPKKKAWIAVSIYTAVVIGLKYISQMPGMCICRGACIHYHYMSVDIMNGDWTNITCPQAECIMDAGITAETYSPMYFFGIVPSNAYFGSVIFWDVIVLFACILHIYLMERQGLWSRPYSAMVDKQHKRFNHTLISLRREAVTASPTQVIAIEKVVSSDPQFLSFNPGDIIKVLLRSKKKGLTTIGDKGDGKAGIFDISKTRPYFGSAEQEEDYQRSESLVNGAEDAGVMNEEEEEEEQQQQQQDRKDAAHAPNKDSGAVEGKELNGEGEEVNKGKKKKMKKKKKTMEERLAEAKPGSWKHFFLNTMFNKSRLGKNYYTPMFLSEFICFIYLLFAASHFTGSSGSLISYIEQSYLPGAYVFVLLIQFIIIIIDRIIYLRRSVVAKLILQYVSLIGLNAIMLWYFPSCMSLSIDPEHWKSSFSSSSSLLVFFLFKCIYWQLSGMQIRDGYPMLSCERFLQKKCTTPRKVLYIIYRWIPFAYEMRTILDWTFIPTTLSFMDYLRIEDIYGDLFKVGCTVNAQKPRKPGTPQSIVTKSIVGCLFFLLLCCILWLPLIIMSSALSGMGAISVAPATQVEVSMSISGWPPFYSQVLTQKSNIGVRFNSSEFSSLRRGREFIRSDSSAVQRIRFSNFSGSLWGLTPPAKEAMLSALEDINDDAIIETKVTATRKSASNQVVSFTHGVKLDRVQRDNFLKVLYTGNGATFSIEGLLPRFITLPGSTGDAYSPCEQSSTSSQCKPVTYEITYYGCFDAYACNITSEGWDFWGISQKPENTRGLFSSSTAEIVFVHTPVSSSSNVLGTLAAYGIVGIYVTLIIAIANVVRGMTSEVSHEIMFVLLPNPFELIQTCRDIILARMDGDLLLEEELSNELIQIYRSPEEIKRHSELQMQEDEQNAVVEDDENDIADDDE